MNHNDTVVAVDGLTKRYDGFLLDAVSLAVPAGSVVGLVGSNGAGKTTIIKAILGLIAPDGGTVSLFGEQVTGAPQRRLAELKQDVGVVLDSCAFPEDLTVKAVGSLVGRAYRAWDPAAYRTLIGQFGLPEKKTVKELSRGMGMKLSLACALAHRPRLLILDEATAGLDPLARDEVLQILRDAMGNECGILMSTHITSDLERIADYVVCIDAGRVVFSVEKDAITDQAGIMQCRAAEFEALAASGLFAPGTLRYERTPYSTRVLVPDRILAAENFRTAAIERTDIDTYLHLTLKGAVL